MRGTPSSNCQCIMLKRLIVIITHKSHRVLSNVVFVLPRFCLRWHSTSCPFIVQCRLFVPSAFSSALRFSGSPTGQEGSSSTPLARVRAAEIPQDLMHRVGAGRAASVDRGGRASLVGRPIVPRQEQAIGDLRSISTISAAAGSEHVTLGSEIRYGQVSTTDNLKAFSAAVDFGIHTFLSRTL